jgi:hypothetical protein
MAQAAKTVFPILGVFAVTFALVFLPLSTFGKMFADQKAGPPLNKPAA